jgi:hypothetical protein
MRNGALIWIEGSCTLFFIIFLFIDISPLWGFIPFMIMGALRFMVVIVIFGLHLISLINKKLNGVFEKVEQDDWTLH